MIFLNCRRQNVENEMGQIRNTISLADDLSFENQMHCKKSMDQVVLLSVCNHSEPNLIRANTF